MFMGVFKKTFLELFAILFVFVLIIIVSKIFINEEVVEVENTLSFKLNEQILSLEIADTAELRSLGLSEREALDENSGMLFVYDQEIENVSFWMRNTLIPLDLIFFNKDFEIVEIIENMPICYQDPCPSYTSVYKVQYAIEVNAGWVSEKGAKIGDKGEIIVLDQSDS